MVVVLTKNVFTFGQKHIHRAYSFKKSIQVFIDRDRQEIKRERELKNIV